MTKEYGIAVNAGLTFPTESERDNFEIALRTAFENIKSHNYLESAKPVFRKFPIGRFIDIDGKEDDVFQIEGAKAADVDILPDVKIPPDVK